MLKYWTSSDKGNDKIIALTDNTICIGNPKSTDIDSCINDLKKAITPTDNFIAIPFHYIKQIKLQEGKEHIEIMFGKDSYETLRISEPTRRAEIFNHFRSTIPNAEYFLDKYSKIRAGKKPLIAIGVFSIIFLWTLYIANGLENGAEYRVVGEQRSVASIVIVLASLGVKKVILIFGCILAISTFAFIKKANNPPTIELLTLRR